jgi:hypothetical protein
MPKRFRICQEKNALQPEIFLLAFANTAALDLGCLGAVGLVPNGFAACRNQAYPDRKAGFVWSEDQGRQNRPLPALSAFIPQVCPWTKEKTHDTAKGRFR